MRKGKSRKVIAILALTAREQSIFWSAVDRKRGRMLMGRKLRAILIALALATVAVIVAPSPAFAACNVHVGTPFHAYGNPAIIGGGNLNGCGSGPYKIKLSQVYPWGLAPVAFSNEFHDGGGSVAWFDCSPGGTHTYRVTIQKYSGWFGIYDDLLSGSDARITC